LRDAELAMYHAKARGKNRCETFTKSLRERATTRMSMVRDLSRAIEGGQLRVDYQPKVDLQTGCVVGFEALLRWQHHEHGLILPGDFIPLAEESGLIIPIGEWVLRESCKQLRSWQLAYPNFSTLTMNVNLSVKQLGDPNLVARVRQILNETAIAPCTLRLELTESALITAVEGARETLAQLQALGVGLKLDDFGTGYSSVSYLLGIHFDSLKIDRSFISKLSDPATHAIVEAMVKLAHTLEMTVVAEGIEEQDQLDTLIRLKCDLGQGYYFSRPVDAAAVEKMLGACYERGNCDAFHPPPRA
jgi:EAL domain-containing protein (putative c-di-GMP-specific phosphodiesterase class I)